MKLIIQIPCYNEEETLPLVVKDFPKIINGVDEIEYLIIDDGSTDKTAEIAQKIGIHHIVKLPYNQGLASAFRAGIDACLKLEADIVVNTDGDNQYDGKDIPKLIEPILKGQAGIVIGERSIDKIEHFPPFKKLLQKMGSWFVRLLSKTDVSDAPSGFRAFSSEALMQLNLISDYSYTLESIIQAGRKNIPIKNVKVNTNTKTRESRLMKSIASYLSKSFSTITRVWLNYAALRIFMTIAIFFILGGLFLGIRFLYYFFSGHGQGHIQSLILMSVLFFIAFQSIIIGFLADLISSNRKILEIMCYELKKLKYGKDKRKDSENE